MCVDYLQIGYKPFLAKKICSVTSFSHCPYCLGGTEDVIENVCRGHQKIIHTLSGVLIHKISFHLSLNMIYGDSGE